MAFINPKGPLQLPGTSGGTKPPTSCPNGQCPDVLVPGYENNGNDGGMALPTSLPGMSSSATPTTPDTTGTGMDMETKPSFWVEAAALIVPGFALAVLAAVIYLSSKKA